MKKTFSFAVCVGISLLSLAQKNTIEAKKSAPFDATTVSALNFRLVGPALTSGRIADLAIHATNPTIWYVAAASGGVWKTTNHGTTFHPIFDTQGSYSIACVELAPSNSNTLWVGTGENNNQRAVAYGDGVYKSLDGGKSFTNMGLKKSEHIGNIIIHPTDENTLWVAAYGPVWRAGGDRGVYKSIDGGKTWERTLYISEDTGVSEIAIDPHNPQILYAASHQRRRQEWTYIGGGPESSLYKSVDGGKTWNEINKGLPAGEMGRIGIAVSPADENFVYAIVEARDGKGGFFQSTNKGENWNKMSGYSTSGNYYQEIVCDATNREKVFIMDTWLHHTIDGGKHIISTGEEKKHVDNHCLWIDPLDPQHWIVGCDGGIYETYNHASDWKYYSNLPIIQFYKVATDNSEPFYNIYGGTQDNNSMGGPSASINNAGILNSDWFITCGGDGFESAIDPIDPSIIYAQAQYGYLVRYDKNSGEKISIQPLPKKGEPAFRWNWDAPLLISPHDPKTLYFAANKVFKTTNRGDDWETISPDLSQQIDRNKLKVMGQLWSVDAVMKNQSTTIYGNIVALEESPIKKGLLYAGTDDGLIQISADGGTSWSRVQSFPGVPANTRVNMITSSLFNENEVFAAFNNHRSGDFKPYLLKSSDKGKTWVNLGGNLPERGSVFCIKQDFIDPNLLFIGTEFGAYFTVDGGSTWTKLSGLPTIAVYDLDIQKRESDLVAATFGRGFYVLDDYSPLRAISAANLQKTAHLFPIKDALLYVPSSPLGLTGTGSQGADLWAAKNPEFGATFSLHLKEEPTTLKTARKEKEKALEKDKKDVFYPSIEALRMEQQEEEAQLIWIIRDSIGKEIKKIISTPSVGISRVHWNLRMETTSPVSLQKSKPGRYDSGDDGQMVIAGSYSVEIVLLKNGSIETIVSPNKFRVKSLNNQTLLATNPSELNTFRKEVAELQRSISGSARIMNEFKSKLELMKIAITQYPNTDLTLLEEVRKIELAIDNCSISLYGDGLKASKEFETPPSVYDRLGHVEDQIYESTSGVTKTQKENIRIVQEEYQIFKKQLDTVLVDIKTLDRKLSSFSIPYTKAQDENWKEE
jgi:photosystem II stability/assembly factor-like uncharacterized protein